MFLKFLSSNMSRRPPAPAEEPALPQWGFGEGRNVPRVSPNHAGIDLEGTVPILQMGK